MDPANTRRIRQSSPRRHEGAVSQHFWCIRHHAKLITLRPVGTAELHRGASAKVNYRFFDAWRAGDYASSFENLHRYFDYTMQTRDKTYYQYALLHMAVVQADFGCFAEAIAAMNEAIATARENQDMSCLNFALSWLNHLGNAYPRQMKGTGYGGMVGSEKDGLAFLRTKAKEGRMWSLLSTTLLSEAKVELSKVGLTADVGTFQPLTVRKGRRHPSRFRAYISICSSQHHIQLTERCSCPAFDAIFVVRQIR